jgi:hypothetical protein
MVSLTVDGCDSPAQRLERNLDDAMYHPDDFRHTTWSCFTGIGDIPIEPLSIPPGYLHHATSGVANFEDFIVRRKFFWQGTLLLLGLTVAVTVCSARPRITRTMDVPESADIPYKNILVIALFEKFDSRRRLEAEVVRELIRLGTEATASTTMMNTKTPMSRETYLAMLDKKDFDAALITHLVDIDSKASLADSASPEATYKVRPTYYFNVWDVRLTEYVEPQSIEVKSSLRLATELYSVLSKDAVWAIESKSKIVTVSDPGANYMIFVDEAEAMVKRISKDRLIARK